MTAFSTRWAPWLIQTDPAPIVGRPAPSRPIGGPVDYMEVWRLGQRVLGIDYGRRRIGLAISDVTRTLARPLTTLTVTTSDALARVLREVDRLSEEEDGLGAIVVGLPTSLDGAPNEQTARVNAFIAALEARTSLPIARGDDRLTSREAESRLAVRERDWRRRKERLDAAAAAVMLQDYLDLVAGKDG